MGHGLGCADALVQPLQEFQITLCRFLIPGQAWACCLLAKVLPHKEQQRDSTSLDIKFLSFPLCQPKGTGANVTQQR